VSVALYMDVHVPRPITRGLRKRGIDVLTAQEDGTARWSDPDLLDRATELARVLFSQDEDLLAEAARRQSRGVAFSGIIYVPQLGLSIADLLQCFEVSGQFPARPSSKLHSCSANTIALFPQNTSLSD